MKIKSFCYSYCDNGEIKKNGFCSTTAGIPTPKPSYIPFGHSTPIAGSTMPIYCIDGWSSWMSASIPSVRNEGDLETIAGLRQAYSFCDSAMMTAIQCRVVGINTLFTESGQQGVVCNLAQGLRCNNFDQRAGEICYDYEVRFDCDCGMYWMIFPKD